MATFKNDFVASFQTSKDTEVEQTQFRAGDSITVCQEWDKFYLIRDAEGHYYNVPKQHVDPNT